MEPGSPVPLIGGWALLVGPEVVVKIGLLGAEESMVSTRGVLCAEALPAGSIAWLVIW